MTKDGSRPASLGEGSKAKGPPRRKVAARHVEAEKGIWRSRRNDIVPSLRIELCPVDALKLHVRKLRKSDPAHIRDIANSISALGFNVPVLIGKNNVVVDGDSRVEAAKMLGLSSVPCIRVDHLDETEQRLLRLAVNRLGEKGVWDLGELEAEFKELIIADAPIEISGFGAVTRHNLMLGLLAGLLNNAEPNPDVRLWTLGASGQRAMQTSPRNAIILGELDERQCRAFADETLGLDYPGVVGFDPIVFWFVERAVERGVKFLEPIPQQICALRQCPIYPEVGGAAHVVNSDDVDLLGQWLTAFLREAAPHDPLPTREGVERSAAAGNYRFWIVDGEPVAMAGIVRRTRRGAAIAGVYTPPTLRNRGYAAAVTAATVDSVFAEGRTMACLYSDLRNAASNRCYAKIGFKPVCRSAAAFVLSWPRQN